jgi:hypothetical protein
MTHDQRDTLAKSVRDVMGEIAHDKRIKPETMTVELLRERGLADDEIDELMKLKHIYDELENDKKLDNKQLIDELNEVVEQIVASAEHSRMEALEDSYDIKLHDAADLKDLANQVGVNKVLGVELRSEIRKSARDIMRDITHDPKLNPEQVTKAKLVEMGLTTQQIDEVLKLKGIYEEVDGDKPVDVEKLIHELEDVADEIRESAEHSRIEDIGKADHSFEQKMADADKLEDMSTLLAPGHKVTESDKEKMKASVRDVMADVAHGKKIDPVTVSRRALEKLGLSEEEIQEILKLKIIYAEVNSKKPLDKAHIK